MAIDMNDDAITSIAQLLTFVNTAETLGVESVKRKDDKNSVYEYALNKSYGIMILPWCS